MATPGRPRASRRISTDFRIYDDFRALPVSERSIVLRHLQYFMQDEVKDEARQPGSGDADGNIQEQGE